MSARMNFARRDQLARSAAAFYRRKCWWADFDDLTQTGHLAIERALAAFNPQLGVPLDGYVWKAITYSLERVLWANSSPVSGGSHRPREAYAGLFRAPLPPEDTIASATSPLAENRTPEKLVADSEWAARVRERLAELSLPEIVDALLDSAQVDTAARKLRVSRKAVQTAVAITRARASADAKLYDLLRLRAEP